MRVLHRSTVGVPIHLLLFRPSGSVQLVLQLLDALAVFAPLLAGLRRAECGRLLEVAHPRLQLHHTARSTTHRAVSRAARTQRAAGGVGGVDCVCDALSFCCSRRSSCCCVAAASLPLPLPPLLARLLVRCALAAVAVAVAAGCGCALVSSSVADACERGDAPSLLLMSNEPRWAPNT